MNYHKAGKSWTKAEIDREVNKEFSAPLLHHTNQGPTYFTKVGDIELRAPEWLIEGLVESGCQSASWEVQALERASLRLIWAAL